MATLTTKQNKNKAVNPREHAGEPPSALEISARDTSLSRLEQLRRRKIARLFEKAKARDNAGI